MSNRERSRLVNGGDYAECPFTISYPTEPSAAARKRKRDSHDGTQFKLAESPFSQAGSPVTKNPMDLYYMVEPRKQWLDLKTFRTVLLNRVNYHVGDFVKVANKATVQQQKSRSNQETNYAKPGDYWVACILEIRASDGHHIYILVYWMYWPDELPSGARIGRKYVQGRQPYHGANELIATNHMEVINVASITEPAVVGQLIESNDEEIQEALYWRQAYNWRTSKLWPVKLWCKCKAHASPDETFIGCTNSGCMEWMHPECMAHDILMKVYKQRVTNENRPGEVTHSLSTIDTKRRDVQHPINIHPKETQADDHTHEDVREMLSETETSTPMSRSLNSKSPRIVKNLKKKGHEKKAAGPKPYVGLFEADLKTQHSPLVWEIRDLRGNVGTEDKIWAERVHCLLCDGFVV